MPLCDNLEGQKLGRAVGDFVLDNALQLEHDRGHTQTGDAATWGAIPQAQFITQDESVSNSSSVMTLLDQKGDDLVA